MVAIYGALDCRVDGALIGALDGKLDGSLAYCT